MNKYIFMFFVVLFCFACKQNHENDEHAHGKEHDHTSEKPHEQDADKKSTVVLKQELLNKGFKIIEFVDQKTKDTVLMQQYFMAFLKKGKNRTQNKQEADSLQRLHLDHLGKMYDLGFADISGPFGDLGDIRGITIYNVPTIEMADSLANADPMVKSGRLEIEMHPWWAKKGAPLR
ncbi:hypothetical protein IMCC3317_30240 [Kordia antarctica]|uniref:YCII-related domain-containing protein n=1 Tax=Kordia antarctica TaxID=1218801 RepID=A0A7L4ZLR4_9FLAO|nr:hypothetical protein [Kordia antarctica]QHI37643.1 hypothetical protein IMCC3317_30240 [Kordia antarctica]